MKIIVIESTVYMVTEKQFESIKNKEKEIGGDEEFGGKMSNWNDFELEMSDYYDENKGNYKLIGDIDSDFRL